MGASFWDAVNEIIRESDVVLEILDARFIDDTRNKEIENKVRRKGKTLIYVLNKCDLVDKDELDKAKKLLHPAVFVSCKSYDGMKMLKERILIEAKRTKKEFPKVGVLGYPNMGKSSIINALNGASKAKTSAQSGYTKGKQYVKARGFILIDSPGVIPYLEKNEAKHAAIGINTSLRDPETALLKILEQFPGIIGKYYGVAEGEDPEETLDLLAEKLKMIKKGGIDTRKASEKVIKDLREGKIKI